MRIWWCSAGIWLIAAGGVCGPISKFEKGSPSASYLSNRKLEDIERCLTDVGYPSAPLVFRQPDRPDDVTLLWTTGSASVGRVDLRRSGAATSVTVWMLVKVVKPCAP